MTGDRQLDERISRWLEAEAPRQMPDRVWQATFARTRTSRQHRGWRPRPAGPTMARTVTALGGAAVLFAAAALALNLGPLSPPSPPTGPGIHPAAGGFDPSPSDPAAPVPLTSKDSILQGQSRDGTRLLIQKDRENLFVVHADGSETQVTTQLTGFGQLPGSSRPSGATISPDGTRVVFAGQTTPPKSDCHDGALFAVDADGGPAVLLWQSQRDGIVREPTFSPDGTQIAFVDGYCDSDHSVWVMNADGSDPHQIVSSDTGPLSATHVHSLDWPPAGDRITLVVDDGRYSFATDGSDFKRITGVAVSPSRSPGSASPSAEPMVAPSASVAASPAHAETLPGSEAIRLLDGSLKARIAGEGADEYGLYPYEVPLLYATSSGDRYERAEFEPVLGKEWPYDSTAYRVRLFASDTVVEQLFFWTAEGPPVLRYDENGFATEIAPTTEDGEPVASQYQYFNGALTLQAAHPWVMSDYGLIPFGRLMPEGPLPPTTDGWERRDWDRIFFMADPAWVGTSCETGLQPGDAEAHAEALAESIQSDPGLEATPPVAVSAGGNEGLMMDVRIAAGATLCWNVDEAGGDPSDDPGILYPVWDMSSSAHAGDGHGTGHASGDWLRLYLFDVPATSGMQWLAIAIVAPESDFERAVGAAVPLVDSIEVQA